ncbi:MAG: RNA-guided endonuclease TnpB family protein, partial [Thermoplasmata archaeon]
MFRTIKLKLPYDRSLIETVRQFKEDTKMVLDYSFENKTFNKDGINKGTYRTVRERISTLSFTLVKTTMGQSSEALKTTNLKKKINKKSITIRYVNGIKFYPDSHRISLTTVHGRLFYPVQLYPLIDKYRGEYTNAQLVIDEKGKRIFIIVQVKISDKEVMKKEEVKVFGIYRGIKNMGVLSNN